MVEFGFEKVAIGALHSHPHVQASYIAEGRFEVTIDGKTESSRRAAASLCRPALSTASRRWSRAGLSTLLRRAGPISSSLRHDRSPRTPKRTTTTHWPFNCALNLRAANERTFR